jgi:hypothetical protein
MIISQMENLVIHVLHAKNSSAAKVLMQYAQLMAKMQGVHCEIMV